MRLSSLEIKGFKSFGERVIIHFDRGVTSIVGPNGSGKSNVVDAMRWVLGEQKMRMLRSEKMENIIFNGTKTRKPANLAEVSLTFENDKGILPTEFSTVCISRRLYRSGDSEYLLNGVVCRLKDIVDLFLDTGIGSDTYSIIELKMVDEIINDRHNTVKMLLEEAAGISKYKLRKKQTLQKLEETDLDLNRVNDLLFEIEKSLKQLEAQAKKTERYYRVKDDYRVSSTALAWFLMRNFTSALEELKIKEEQQAKEKNELQLQLEGLEENLLAQKISSEEKEKALSAAQKQLNEKLFVINRFENEQKSRLEKLNYLNEKKEQLSKQINSDHGQIELLNKQIEDLNIEKQKEETRFAEMETELQQAKQKVEESKQLYEASADEVKQINMQLLQVRQAVNHHETFVAVRQARINSINEQAKRLIEQITKDKQQLDAIELELTELNSKKEFVEKEALDKKHLRLQLEEEIRTADVFIKEHREALAEERRLADVKTNEYELTKSLVEQMEGFPESIKYLKKNYDRFKNVPLLSDIVNCNDDYKVAIENFLEPFLNHFIADTQTEAWEALDILGNQNKGRAHFFVLNTLSNFNFIEKENVHGCIAAADVIETDEKYRSLFNYLLGHVYILNDDIPLSQLPLADNHSIVVLSRNGKFQKQKYSISGGSVGMAEGKRTGRLQNLEKLAAEISNHKTETERLKNELHNAEVQLLERKTLLADTQNSIYTLDSELSKSVLGINTHISKKDFISSNNDANERSMQKLHEELNDIEQQKNTASGFGGLTFDEMKLNLQRLTIEQKEKQEFSNELQKNSQEAGNQYNQVNIAYLQQQNRIQNITREIGYKQTQQTNINTSIENNTLEIESLNEQIVQTSNAGETGETDLQKHSEEKIQFEHLLNESEKNYFESKGEIENNEKLIAETRRKKEIADDLMHAVHNESNEVNLKMTSLKERLSVEFEIDVNDIVSQEPNPEWNEEELKLKTEKFGNQLKNFGPINPMALESFKEIKERYDFIIKEQDDLKKAKESLLQTISEIENTAKEKFLEVFTQVRTNFITVFRSLFTDDDNCDLILADMNNPLDSEIEIIAQPKGKKPLSISQLSGGERTLTATALLFGLYLVKPAPFCIFDEVDAPLDDNNIDKFNNIIKKFSAESQFIIITHNKKTMAATDIIYGITMNEPGVTAVVPVDLREYAEA